MDTFSESPSVVDGPEAATSHPKIPTVTTKDDVTVPLFVDLDGTLIRSDLLIESFLGRLRSDPLVAFRWVGWLFSGRAHLKARLAEGDPVDVATLPLHEPFVDHLRNEVARGRKLILATASHRSLAEAVARNLGIFSGVLASDGQTNLKGRVKLAAIRSMTGGRDFDYAGNDADDLPIWAAARTAIVVGATNSVHARAIAHGNVGRAFPAIGSAWALFRAMRPHQWLKNALVVVPLLTSVSFLSTKSWLHSGLAFLTFCALSSCAYIVNDLVDLTADRRHPDKRRRPFAAGLVSPIAGMATALALVLAAMVAASTLPDAFSAFAAAYFALTLAYSFWIKSLVVADVVALAMLYTVRIVAGVAAIGVALSFWLLAFSIFIFFSLALMKRCTELVMWRARAGDDAVVRGYRVSDQEVLQSLGVASACVAVLVFALYIHSPEVTARLATPSLLWPVCVIMLYWLGRTWILCGRGEMHNDPLVFAWKDRVSLYAGALSAALFAAAALVKLPILL